MPEDDENPYNLLDFIDKPEKWRLVASKILIQIFEDTKRDKWRQAAIIGLLIFVISLLLKLIFAA